MKYKIADKNILGTPIQKDESYTIIGAGISGLMLGYYLKKNGISFKILEKGNRAGGLIHTHKVEGLGLAEAAANGFVWCKELADMCEDLGLEIQSPDAASKARYLVRDNEMRKFPLGIMETIGMAARFWTPHHKQLETVEDFGHTYFGKTFTNQILEPAFAGIYGAPISNLSFSAVLRPFAEKLNHTNFLPKALYQWKQQAKTTADPRKRSGTQSFEGGLGKLATRLAEHLKEHIHYNEEITAFSDEPTIITTPAYIAKDFFKGEMNASLEKVNYTPFVTTTLFFNKKDIPDFKPGFGCLIPRSEGLTILGVLFNSCIFSDRVENDELISLTCMLRDYEGTIINQEENQIVDHVLMPDLQKLLGVEAAALGYKMFKWRKGIPIYNNELMNMWETMDLTLQKKYPNVRLLGNYTGQISIRGIAQFIAKAF
jgi:oxygen-dependent protoporphyrinogen oxidase